MFFPFVAIPKYFVLIVGLDICLTKWRITKRKLGELVSVILILILQIEVSSSYTHCCWMARKTVRKPKHYHHLFLAQARNTYFNAYYKLQWKSNILITIFFINKTLKSKTNGHIALLMKLDPIGMALLFCYILLCLFYCIQTEKEKSNNICQLVCNFLHFQTTSLSCMIMSPIPCPEELNCWVRNLFRKCY